MPGVSLNLLDPNLGIQNVMDSGNGTHMPDARPLASTVLREAGWMNSITVVRRKNSSMPRFALRWETAPSCSPKIFRPNSELVWIR